MRNLAKYDWSYGDKAGTVILHDNELVTTDKGTVPVMVAAAVRFMFVTSAKELTVDGYSVSWHLTYPSPRKG